MSEDKRKQARRGERHGDQRAQKLVRLLDGFVARATIVEGRSRTAPTQDGVEVPLDPRNVSLFRADTDTGTLIEHLIGGIG